MGRGSLNFGFLTEGTRISSRKFVAVTILSSSTLAWFFLSFGFFQEDIFTRITNDLFWVYAGKALYLSFGAVSAIAGSSISQKLNRRTLLWSWTILGVLTTASLAVFHGVLFSIIASMLLGISFGLGYPAIMAFLTDCTVPEERARVAGIIFLETFVFVTIATVAYQIFNLGVLGVIGLCIVLRSTGFLALILDSCNGVKEKASSWRTVFAHKNFILYLIPWLMFNVASGLITFSLGGFYQDPNYEGALRMGNTLHFLTAGVFGFIAGFAADRFGRKQPIILGLVMLGVSFAFLGLATSWVSVLVYLTISGIAWGFLMVVYTAVPGDLAFPGSKEKFLALATIIPFIIYMSLSGVADFFSVSFPAGALSSILSIILFVSVIPVLRATETLPETTMRERKLREHIKKVG